MKAPQTTHDNPSNTDDLDDLECGVTQKVFQFVYRVSKVIDEAERNGLSGIIMKIHLIGLAHYCWAKGGYAWDDHQFEFSEALSEDARTAYERDFEGIPILDF